MGKPQEAAASESPTQCAVTPTGLRAGAPQQLRHWEAEERPKRRKSLQDPFCPTDKGELATAARKQAPPSELHTPTPAEGTAGTHKQLLLPGPQRKGRHGEPARLSSPQLPSPSPPSDRREVPTWVTPVPELRDTRTSLLSQPEQRSGHSERKKQE